MTNAEKLRAWRLLRNPPIPQVEVGAAIGVSGVSVTTWERGRTLPSVEYRRAIERLTGGAVPAADWGDDAERARYRRLEAVGPLGAPEPAPGPATEADTDPAPESVAEGDGGR